MKIERIGVIGGGSWGTALAVTLAGKGHQVRIWDIDKDHLLDMQKNRENRKFLPGIEFPETLEAVMTVAEAMEAADYVLFSAPAQFFRSALENALPELPREAIVINVAKGIERDSLKRLSEVAHELAPDLKYVVLSGPSHAEEVGKRLPTTVAVASDNRQYARAVQELFFTDRFRTYINDDVIGLELGGALKNIIALGAGISDGMGFGDNAKAALMTRGLTEMKRLGVKLGAKPETFAGLAGVGDLIVTCTSMHSRNRKCGIMIGEGLAPDEATKRVGMVVEGMFTTQAAYDLAKKVSVEMPITESIYDVINGKLSAEDAVDKLMGRAMTHEEDDVE